MAHCRPWYTDRAVAEDRALAGGTPGAATVQGHGRCLCGIALSFCYASGVKRKIPRHPSLPRREKRHLAFPDRGIIPVSVLLLTFLGAAAWFIVSCNVSTDSKIFAFGQTADVDPCSNWGKSVFVVSKWNHALSRKFEVL